MIRLSKDQARDYFVQYQLLDKRIDKTDLDEIFRRIRTIQYDPLKVVGRNADLVLKARIKDYHPTDLENWLYSERSLIDGWDKMMNIYPQSDRDKMFPIAANYAGEIQKRGVKLLGNAFYELGDEVRKRLLQGEVLKNNQLTKELGMGKQGYYTPVHLLDYLYHLGEAEILTKEHTQKVYRQASKPPTSSADEAFLDWYVYRRIEATGLIRPKGNDAWLGYYTWYREH